MKNITSKVSRDDMDNARIDRDRATNPAESPPGMGEEEDWGFGSVDEPFPSSGWGSNLGTPSGGGGAHDFSGGINSSGTNFFGGGGFNSPYGSGLSGGMNQPNQNKEEIEDKLFGLLGKFFVGLGQFTSEFIKSFKFMDVHTKIKTGRSTLIVGIIMAVVGAILALMGYGHVIGFDFLIGGLISTAVGTVLFMFSYEEYRNNPEPTNMEHFNPSGAQEQSNMSDFDNSFGESSFGQDSYEFNDDEFDLFSDDDEDEESEYMDSDIDFGGFDDFEPTSQEDLADTAEKVLDNLLVNDGMLTRSYLYENISSCLQSVNRSYSKVRVLPEGSDEFDAWDAIVQNSANLFKPKGNDVEMPYLISAEDKLFYVLLEIKRVPWIKNVDALTNEIVSICQFDKDTGKTNKDIYGIGTAVGNSFYIRIMKGETTLITIKDAYQSIESEVKDPNNFMPVVMGLDSEGSVIWKDFKNIESILVTGMPRSGKTWAVIMILAQMMSYMKPSELNFYILDPKEGISDYKFIQSPHVRKFVHDDAEILKELRHVVRVEGPRRKKIIGDAGFVNIWDYKKKNPDAKLPLLYVVIDEVVTLAERMEDNVKKEFQGLLLELVSQLPALGIRIFMIPHVVKDQVLKKSITDLVPCRISVCGDAEHIERSLAIGKGVFKHKLSHVGDMAVKFANSEPMFIHSAVLSNSNQGNEDFFEFLLKFWSKVEPESLKGSLHEQLQRKKLSTGSDSFTKIDITNNFTSGEKTSTVGNSYRKLNKNEQQELLSGVTGEEIDLWDK